MAVDEPYYVEVGETLVGRKAGESALQTARELEAAAPHGLLKLFQKPEDRTWRVGAAGEQQVAHELERLPKEWFVLQDIPIGMGKANVDHLAVGPGGIFSLNTKNLTGRVWVAERAFLHNGHKTDYLPKSSGEARRVARVLGAALGRPVQVKAVLVVLCKDLTIKAQPPDVAVLTRFDMCSWLEGRPRILTAREIFEIAVKAQHLETWRSS